MTIPFTLTLHADGSTASLKRADGESFTTKPVADVLHEFRSEGVVIEADQPKLRERTLTMRYKGGGDYGWSPRMTSRLVQRLEAKMTHSKVIVENEPV